MRSKDRFGLLSFPHVYSNININVREDTSNLHEIEIVRFYDSIVFPHD